MNEITKVADFSQKLYELVSLVVDRKNMALKTAIGITKPDALSAGFRITTMDYGDKTTWYQNAIYHDKTEVAIDAAASDAANNNYVINVADTPLVNIYSPRLSAPRRYLRVYSDVTYIGGLLMADGSFKQHSDFEIKLYKNDIAITSHITNIDYMGGTISTSNVDFLDTDIITATFWCLPETNASQFILRPHEDVKWYMKHVEMQLSVNTTFCPTVVFEMWGGKEDYNYDFSSPEDRAYHVGYEMHYRGITDYINVGNEGKGYIPACGELSSNLIVFPFNYDRALDVGNDGSSVGKLIRIYSIDDLPYEGSELATTSFYIEQTRITL